MGKQSAKSAVFGVLAATALCALVAGCGSSDGVGSTTINGQAIAGAVDGTVVVTTASGNAVASAAVVNGTFSIALPNTVLNDKLDFEVTGTYPDEVSGGSVTLTPTYPLALRVASGRFIAGGSGNAPITFGSSVIRDLVKKHGLTLAQAQTTFESHFGYQPAMNARPFDPAATDASTAAARPQMDRDAAMRAGMFSQLAAQIGLAGDDIPDLIAALAEDLADGTPDGRNGSNTPISVGASALDLATFFAQDPLPTRILVAFSQFSGHANNQAGLNSSGMMGLPNLAFDTPGIGSSQTVTTKGGNTVTVAYDTVNSPPFGTGFMVARTQHKITLTDTNGLPLDITAGGPILDVSQHPFMNMLSGHAHSAPHAQQADTTDAANGNYLLDTYYVMSSQMMGSGMAMGVWDYSVRIIEDNDGNNTVDPGDITEVMFHPNVMMPMGGDVLFGKVGNGADTWTNMMGFTESRPYRAWLHEASANGDGSHTVSLFISTRDMMNMPMGMTMAMGHGTKFPAVYPGQTLYGPKDAMGMRPQLTVAAVNVEISTNGTSWQPLTEVTGVGGSGTGRYTHTAVTGLDNAIGQDSLSVRFSVDIGSGANAMTTAAGANPELRFTAP